MSKNCYCGSSNSYKECCEKYINSSQSAPTAEALMRSRYSAYATQAIDYLITTTAFLQRKFLSKKDVLEWSQNNKWNKLEIVVSTSNTVEFKVFYIDSRDESHIHHEKSIFIIEDGKWCYVDGEFY